ncbi:iron ABC transporter permease [Roseomonas sp. 18066]|uniref:FecCD family ABC transporter permease n=1 Tax=Roseomonas sp. 18066 TaxID=2681412 RepID=UPI001359D9FB|nr:iron ABC transporter permease [Roseomonas sp. 18066]
MRPFFLLAGGLLAIALLHLLLGARPVSPLVLWQVLAAPDHDDYAQQIVTHFRLPRLLAGLVAGSGLALCGALLQALVRNPLAEPQLLGLNAGAALAVVAGGMLLPALPPEARPLLAAGGALALFAGVLGLAQSGRDGATPIRLLLCGVAVTALAGAVTTGLLLLDEQALAELRTWLAGDLAAPSVALLLAVSPLHLLAIAAAFLLAPQLALLALGDAVAQGLGVRLGRLRLAAVLVAALLCGGAVTVAGPIGFLGLLVPLLARRLLGTSLPRIFLGCLLGGPLLLLAADLVARTILLPQEIATGIVTGLLGAPVFVALIARGAR